MLAKERKARFQTAQEVRDALVKVSSKLGRAGWLNKGPAAVVPLVRANDPVAWHKGPRRSQSGTRARSPGLRQAEHRDLLTIGPWWVRRARLPPPRAPRPLRLEPGSLACPPTSSVLRGGPRDPRTSRGGLHSPDDRRVLCSEHRRPTITSDSEVRSGLLRQRRQPAASHLEALRQRNLMAAVAMLGQMPRGVGLRVDPHRFGLDRSWSDAGGNSEGHRAGRHLSPR